MARGGIKIRLNARVVRDKDLGMDKLIRLLNFLGGRQRSVEVGLVDGTRQEVLDRAAINEFGAPPFIPRRPWFSATVDQNTDRYLKKLEESFWEEFRAPQRGVDGNALREKVAQMVVDDLKEAITQRKFWPKENPSAINNAPETIRKKGFDHPLIETGELLESIRYKIKDDD